jgi:hypothetical protein
MAHRLTRRQTEILANRIADQFNNGHPKVDGLVLRNGWFPYDLVDTINSIMQEYPADYEVHGLRPTATPARIAAPSNTLTGEMNNNTRRYVFSWPVNSVPQSQTLDGWAPETCTLVINTLRGERLQHTIPAGWRIARGTTEDSYRYYVNGDVYCFEVPVERV